MEPFLLAENLLYNIDISFFLMYNYIKNDGGRFMNIWHDISPERIKAEDFILYTSTHSPTNYGFIPRTYGDDGDPLDVLVLTSEPLDPLVLIRCYPIGVINMIDNGNDDEKIIAIPYSDPMYNSYKDISELPSHIFDEMRHFFSVYKQLEGKQTAVEEVKGASAALAVISKCIGYYNEKFGGHRIEKL